MASQAYCQGMPDEVATPVKQQSSNSHQGVCPYGSPVGGLCCPNTSQQALPVHISSTQRTSYECYQPTSGVTLHPAQHSASPSPRQARMCLSWEPKKTAYSSNTHSMPELQQAQASASQPTVPAYTPARSSLDIAQLKDQGLSGHVQQHAGSVPRAQSSLGSYGHYKPSQTAVHGFSHTAPSSPTCIVSPVPQRQSDSNIPFMQQQQASQRGQLQSQQQQPLQLQHGQQTMQQHTGQTVTAQPGQQDLQPTSPVVSQSTCSTPACITEGSQVQQQQQQLPLDVLLSPLLPSADKAKLLERLGQLRMALDEQHRLAAGWEQQAVTLQQALADSQQEGLTLNGQVVSLQQNINLLGGNLQGRLAMVQGAVLADMQAQAADKDQLIAASERQLAAIQAELERLSCSFSAKLAAEQTERERASAEASQARLLCMARGRQVLALQQELQQVQQNTSQQQETAAASAGLQQEQLEGLHQRLQAMQAQLQDAQANAADAAAQAAAAEGGTAALRQQVDELQAALADKQLQTEWLEGKVADLEGSSMNHQYKRQASDLAQLQTAAAERQALQQQLATAQAQLTQLQQHDAVQQKNIEQLQQQITDLQMQLAVEQQAAAEQQQQMIEHLHEAHRQMQHMQEQVQQGHEQLITAGGDKAATQDQLQVHWAAQLTGAAADGVIPDHEVEAVVVEHALRAELGIAHAEVARLQAELDVVSASCQQERHLTTQEILRLQHELSDAAASASAVSSSVEQELAEAAEVTSSTVQEQPKQQHGDQVSWKLVHDNPAFEDAGLTAWAAAGASQLPQGKHRVDAKNQLTAATAASADVNGKQIGQYEARLQDQANTISSLQRQLKQQQQLLAVLQKRERRVYDSAASRAGWTEALDLDETHQQQEATATVRHLAVYADAAVQTEEACTESAGSTAAATPAQQFACSAEAGASCSQQRYASRHGSSAWSEGAAGSALLAAARQEIQRLQELNQQLLLAHAQELKASVRFEDAKRAVSEAKTHTKAKAAALFEASNKAWEQKLAAATTDKELLIAQVEELKQQREQLQVQAAMCARSKSAVHQLEHQLEESQIHCLQLQQQLADLQDSHAQELDQVRMEAEADAAAAILDATGAAMRRSMQAQQQQRADEMVQVQLPPQLDHAVQTSPAVLQDGATQTDLMQQQQAGEQQQQQVCQSQHQQQTNRVHELKRKSSNFVDDVVIQAVSVDEQQSAWQQPAWQQPDLVVQQQHQSEEQNQQPATPMSTPAERPCTPQLMHAAAVSCAPAAAVPAAMPVQDWHVAGDDDMCRMSSASDTPVSTRLHSSRSMRSVHLPAAATATGTEQGSSGSEGSVMERGGSGVLRPDSADSRGLPELGPSTSPIAKGTGQGWQHGFAAQQALHAQVQQAAQHHTAWQLHQQQHLQQQEEQQPQLQHVHSQQPHQQQPPPTDSVARMSGWHVELLQQKAQLDMLRMRLSQHHHQHASAVPVQLQRQWQQQQQPSSIARPQLGSAVTARPANTGAAALASPVGGGDSKAADTPLMPLQGGNSPLTVQQRRQQQADHTAGRTCGNQQPVLGPIRGSTMLTADSSAAAVRAGIAAGGRAAAGRASHHGWVQGKTHVVGMRYGMDSTSTSDWRLTDTHSQPTALCQVRAAGWTGSTTSNIAGLSTNMTLQTGLSSHTCSSFSSSDAAAFNTAATMPGASGLGQLHDGVMVALSESRRHREESRRQEQRAKEHALNAQIALEQAAAVRSSRLSAAALQPAEVSR